MTPVRFWLAALLITAPLQPIAAEEPKAPGTVKALWPDFDPREDALETKIVREGAKDRITSRSVTFHAATFKTNRLGWRASSLSRRGRRSCRACDTFTAAGNGQFCTRSSSTPGGVTPACQSIGAGGRWRTPRPATPTRIGGAVDPTQKNVPGYFNLKPGDKTIDPFASPRNNNWYLLTVGARRGRTFRGQQPVVDADRFGVYGHSMGGKRTVSVAGCDTRVKAAAPSVGGSGFRTQPWPLLPEHKPQLPNGDVKQFDATLGFESYAPRVMAPLLWLGSTNDFHGIMDDTYRTGSLIPHANVRYAFAPHLNHRFTPEFEVARPLWFDQHLKKAFTFPATSASELNLATADGVPELRVTPDASQPVAEVQVYYSIDPDPRARFWPSAAATKSGGTWTAHLPVPDTDRPLFAFANVVYRLKKAEPVPLAKPTETYAISTVLHTRTPKELHRAGVKATDKPTTLIDDFANGWQDWYTLSADNPHHWEFSTRKLSDPTWQGKPGQRLTFEVTAEKPNELVVLLTENFFRPYRGQQRQATAVVKLTGGKEPQTVSLRLKDFGDEPSSWQAVDVLSLRAYVEADGKLLGSKSWAGGQPRFRNLRWEGADR